MVNNRDVTSACNYARNELERNKMMMADARQTDLEVKAALNAMNDEYNVLLHQQDGLLEIILQEFDDEKAHALQELYASLVTKSTAVKQGIDEMTKAFIANNRKQVELQRNMIDLARSVENVEKQDAAGIFKAIGHDIGIGIRDVGHAVGQGAKLIGKDVVGALRDVKNIILHPEKAAKKLVSKKVVDELGHEVLDKGIDFMRDVEDPAEAVAGEEGVAELGELAMAAGEYVLEATERLLAEARKRERKRKLEHDVAHFMRTYKKLAPKSGVRKLMVLKRRAASEGE